MKVQVTRLESAVEKLAREKQKKPRQHVESVSSNSANEDTPDSFFTKMNHAPIYSLFDNEIVRILLLIHHPLLTPFKLAHDETVPTHGLDTTTHVQFLDLDLSDRAKLLRTIEHIPDVLQVADHAHDWSVHLKTVAPYLE